MAKRIIGHKSTVTETNLITTSTSTPIKVGGGRTIAVQVEATDSTPSAKSFETSDVNAGTDTITESSHGFTTGLKGQFTTTTTLPAGLSLATDYFIIDVDGNSYKVASSLANALAGTEVDITDQGTGTHTFTPTSLAGGSIVVQKSNVYDSEQNSGGAFDNVGSVTNITATGNYWLEISDPGYEYIRLSQTLTAGALNTVSTIIIKEDV